MITPLELQSRLNSIRLEIEAAAARSGRNPTDIRLIAVTKTQPAELVQMVVDAGVMNIGENRVQELLVKAPVVKGCTDWHMIGHLQTNKVKKVIEQAQWIHSVDSRHLADEIEKYCAVASKKMKCLVEINTSGEESKSGCSPDQALDLCEKVATLEHLELRGLMTIGPLRGSEEQTRASFRLIRSIGERIRHLVSSELELSMGMSNDFVWAIEEGSTMVRIGTRLVGERPPADFLP